MLKILMIKAGYFLKKKMLNCIFSEFSVLSWSLLTINFFFLLRKTAQYPFFPQQFTSTSIPNLILVLCCQISTTSRPCRNLVWLTPLHGSRDNATSEVWCKGDIHCYEKSWWYVYEVSPVNFDLNTQADLWSVGAILFQLVTGKTPYTGNNQIQVWLALFMCKTKWFFRLIGIVSF